MQRISSTDLLRFTRLGASILFAVYAFLLATHAPQGFPADASTHSFWPWLADKPLNEDGFYMLTVADNFATGHGLAYNFGPPVTGIQPLSTLIFAAIAYLVHHMGGDAWTFVRVILLFGSATHLLFAWLMARFSASLLPTKTQPFDQALVSTVAFFIVLCDLTVFRLQTCGLETGIYLCLLAACITFWHKLVTAPSTRMFCLLGVAGGFCGLARIDFGLIFALLIGYLLVRRIGAAWQVLTAGLIALLIVSPWFIYVHHIIGGWMPTSGSVESGFTYYGFDRVTSWLLAVLAHAAPWSYAAINHLETTSLAVVSVPALAAIAFGSLRRDDSPLAAAFANTGSRDTLFPWGLAMLALSVVYAITFQSTFFYVRYFVPLLLTTVPIVSLILSSGRLVQSRPFIPLLLLCFLFSGQLVATLHRGSYGNPRFLSAAYLIRNFPGVHIGAWQSGVLGYVDRDVENLDGKLSAEAYHATQTHTLGAFIDGEGIDVLSDWPGYLIGTLPPGYLEREWQPCSQPRTTTDDVCYVRKTFAAAHPEFR